MLEKCDNGEEGRKSSKRHEIILNSPYFQCINLLLSINLALLKLILIREWRDRVVSFHCPVHGGWTQWSRWSDCSVTCETGIRIKMRSCTNPLPLHGGMDCQGPNSKSMTCEALARCPDHRYFEFLDNMINSQMKEIKYSGNFMN